MGAHQRSIANLVAWLRANAGITVESPRDIWIHALSRDGHAHCSWRRGPCPSCRVAQALSTLDGFVRAEETQAPEIELVASLAPESAAYKELTQLRAQVQKVEHGLQAQEGIRPERAIEAARVLSAALAGVEEQMATLRGTLVARLPHREFAEPPGRQARQLLLRDVEYELRCGGFPDTKIAEMIDDGLLGTVKQRIDRVGKRRASFKNDEVTGIDPKTAVGLLGYSWSVGWLRLGERDGPRHLALIETLTIRAGLPPFYIAQRRLEVGTPG